MILARKTYYDLDGYPVKGEFRPNKTTSIITDGRRSKMGNSQYPNENGFYFYNNGGPMI